MAHEPAPPSITEALELIAGEAAAERVQADSERDARRAEHLNGTVTREIERLTGELYPNGAPDDLDIAWHVDAPASAGGRTWFVDVHLGDHRLRWILGDNWKLRASVVRACPTCGDDYTVAYNTPVELATAAVGPHRTHPHGTGTCDGTTITPGPAALPRVQIVTTTSPMFKDRLVELIDQGYDWSWRAGEGNHIVVLAVRHDDATDEPF